MEDLIRILKQGEGEEVEFKSHFVKDIAKDICAFSNTVGGHVLFGIDDKGEVVGTGDENIEQKVSDVLQGIYPHPDVKMEMVKIGDKQISHIIVSPSDRLHSVGNVVYLRMGLNNRPLSTHEVIEKAAESALVFFDELPSDVPLEAISQSMVTNYLEKRRSIRGVNSRGSIEDNLILLKIVKDVDGIIKPTKGGLLFFSENPQEYLPNARVRLVWFQDEDMRKYIDSREFSGPIWKMVDDIEDYFLKNLKVVGGAMTGWKREEFLEYPMDALREAVINALIHRNFFDASEVQIFIFPSSIRIKNPGNFPPGVTPEVPEHKPRNPYLSQYMYDMGYVEKYGSGIRKIKMACDAHPLVMVDFILKPYRTELVFRKDKVPKLDEPDMKVLDLVRILKSTTSTEISQKIGLSRVSVVKRLNNLVLKGFIEKTGQGRSTRYAIADVRENQGI